MSVLAKAAARRRRAAGLNFLFAIGLGLGAAVLGFHVWLFPAGGYADAVGLLLTGVFAWGSGYSARHALRIAEGL